MEEEPLFHHEVVPMYDRSIFTASEDFTPEMKCPYCNYNGRGWEKFPKPSLCGKISAAILTVICMCCLPFCCDCSIEWEWMCPSCHQCHSSQPEEAEEPQLIVCN